MAGSGKTTSQRHLVQQLIRLGTKANQDSKIGTQIRASRDILEAFGNCLSEHGPNASRHSLYLELQYKAKGRLFGAKLLPFMLSQELITDAPSHLGSYQVFYAMFRDASNEDRKRLRLGNNIAEFRYLPYHPHMDQANASGNLTPAFAAMGFKPKAISQIWQLLAAILHLGRIDFVDSTQDPTVMATVPRQRHIFEHVADLLGVEEGTIRRDQRSASPWVDATKQGLTVIILSLVRSNRRIAAGTFVQTQDDCWRHVHCDLGLGIGQEAV